MMNRSSLVLVLVSLAAMLTGCGPANNSLRGKVIEGPVSFMMPVDANDPRLAGPGIADVAVEARAGTGRGSGTKYCSAKTNDLGEFRLAFGDQQAVLMRTIEFVGEKPGYQMAKVEMNLFSSSRRLLIVLQPVEAPKPTR
jgi:hypothetical protein